MIRKVCTLMVMIMAACGAFVASPGPDADAQGMPDCGLFVPADAAEVESAESDTDVGSDEPTVERDCADVQHYPGPFTNAPTVPAGPFIAPVLSAPGPVVVDPIEEPTTTTATTTMTTTTATTTTATTTISSRDLAHSGTETFVLAYLGTGLLAFGAFAMGIRRGGRRG